MTDKLKNRMIQVDNRFIITLGINPGILLSELLDKENHCIEENLTDKDGYFFHEKSHIYIRTALTREKFDTARKKLENTGILKTKLGKGKRLYFKIDDFEYSKFIYPKAQEVIPKSIIHEELTKEGYFLYNIGLAHRIGINETILLTDLISKRNYFSLRGELMKGFFFNSVSNIEKTTSLTKKQQISSILKLEKENLIQVEIVDNNTRYFSLNNDKIDEYKQSNYEEFLKVESGISNTSESGKSNTLEKLVNKFESGKSNTSESGIGYSSERVKGNTTKVEKVIGGKSEKIDNESGKSDTNNNYITTSNEKELINNNKEEIIRSLLFKYFKKNKKEDGKQVEIIIKNYSLERIHEVINECDKKQRNSPIGFIREALEKNWEFSKNNSFNEKYLLRKKQDEIELNNTIIHQLKNDNIKKLIDEWITNNKEDYNILMIQETEAFSNKHKNFQIKDPSVMIKSNVRAFIKTAILGL